VLHHGCPISSAELVKKNKYLREDLIFSFRNEWDEIYNLLK
jgi:hypothetical protein